MTNNNIPKDGIEGLKQNWQADMLSGFLVFILALPLSMGIAQASDFSPIYGLITATVGGLVVALFAGSQLTIKGPAAGLIVIVAGAVSDFGGGDLGWKLTLGAIVVAGVFQILFGILKLGSLSDFFPLSAVHGMLAAIGIIIISKQFHVLLGQNPVHGWLDPELADPAKSKPLVEPFELFEAIPHTLSSFDHIALIVGLVSLVIVFGWPMIKNNIAKKIPAPLIVLLVAIPLSKYLAMNPKLFVHFDKGLIDTLAVNVSFDGIAQTGTFIKYVIMFALVGSLEALLTVKAIDIRDPWKRKANANKDLTAVGIGNSISGILGGLPMISEVARSSANVNNGGRTRWANFFHGFFLLIFLLFAVQFSDLIPKPALAAMLIGVGYKLAHPREFKHMLHVGKEQLVIFIATIIATLATDLLIGIFVGIIVKIIFELSKGVKFSEMFKTKLDINENADQINIAANTALVFSNYISLSKQLAALPAGKKINFDVSKSTLIDHSTIENLHHFEDDYNRNGGHFNLTGLDHFIQLSKHKFSVRVNKSQQEKK
jgi:MFS superfamily sulfate permease-like transporter